MSFTNAQLATKIADLISYWSSFNEEYSNWLGGTVSGGPGSDGKYTLTDYTGAESLIESPAKLADNVSGYVGLASASEAAAAISAAAALASESNASTSAATATAQAVLADADRVAAELAETNATNAQVTAVVQANLAATRAAAALVSEDASAVSAAAALVSELAAAASAAAAATFDPLNFYLRTALDGGQLDNRYYTETEVDATFANYTLTSGLNIANWNTAYSWGDHAGTYLPLTGGTLTGSVTIDQLLDEEVFIRFQNDRPWSFIGTGVGAAAELTLRSHNNKNFQIQDSTSVNQFLFSTNTGNFTATGDVLGANLNVSNWDTAYGWGDHASGGYAPLASPSFTGNVTIGGDLHSGSQYLDVRGGGAGATGVRVMDSAGTQQGYLYGSSQTFGLLNSAGGWIMYAGPASSNVTFPGVLTWSGGGSANANTAYGWGDHASQSYLTDTVATDSPDKATELTSGQDLNNLGAAQSGFYYQSANADTAGNNYPSGEAGSLLVQRSAGVATQLYITYPTTNNKMFFRSNYIAGWTAWHELVHKDDSTWNATDWDTAFGWGDHASGGYQAALTTTLTLESSAADVSLFLKADTSNTIETANPFIRFEQDANIISAVIGTVGAANVDAQGATFTNMINNGFAIKTTTGIGIGVGTTAGIVIDGSNKVTFKGAVEIEGVLTKSALGIPYHVSSGYTGGKITVASTAPGTPAQGDIWFDTT